MISFPGYYSEIISRLNYKMSCVNYPVYSRYSIVSLSSIIGFNIGGYIHKYKSTMNWEK